MAHIQAHEQPKNIVHERVGGVRDCWLCGMVSLAYRTKADTKNFGVEIAWARVMGPKSPAFGRRMGFDGQDNWIVRPMSWRCFGSCGKWWGLKSRNKPIAWALSNGICSAA